MVKNSGGSQKPVIGITCEVNKLKPYYSEFELVCDYRYVRAIIRAGGIPILIPINHDERSIQKLLGILSGLLITGGADIHPSFYGETCRQKIQPMYRGRTLFDIKLYRMAERKNLPVLTICYGTQLLNVIYGGTLFQDIQKEIPRAANHRSRRKPFHLVQLTKDSKLAQAFGKSNLLVHSEHHQAVKKLAPKLRAVGYSEDGIIEAVEGPSNVFSVQWHPERQERDLVQRKLFRRFILLCKKKHL